VNAKQGSGDEQGHHHTGWELSGAWTRIHGTVFTCYMFARAKHGGNGTILELERTFADSGARRRLTNHSRFTSHSRARCDAFVHVFCSHAHHSILRPRSHGRTHSHHRPFGAGGWAAGIADPVAVTRVHKKVGTVQCLLGRVVSWTDRPDDRDTTQHVHPTNAPAARLCMVATPRR
jgi:hypothetical protein